MSNNKDLITIYNSHSGDSFRVNRHYFVALDEIKKFCSKQFNIPIQQIFLISPFGLKLKITFLEQLDEVYVFDRNLFSVYNDEQVIRRYIRGKYSMDSLKENLVQPIHSPLEDIDLIRITQSRNARQLIGLLTTNLGWVSAIQSDTRLFVKRSKEVAAKTLILLKALKVAGQYIEGYCGDIKKQFDSSFDSVINIQKHSLNLTWNDHLKKLGGIYDINQMPLSDLLNKKELSDVAHKSVKISENVNSSFISQKAKLKSSKSFRDNVDTDLTSLEKEIVVHLNSLQLDTKLQTINITCDRMQSETKTLLSQANAVDDISIDLILDSFTTQKSKFVTQIFQQSNELYGSLKKLIEIFNRVQLQMCAFLQRLSQAQADMVTLKESLKDITSNTESIQSLESKLCLTIDLPLLYGLYLTECLRRDEWSRRVKKLTASTNENFAGFKEREVKARSIWMRNYGEVLSLLGIDSNFFNSSGILSIDLNLIEEVDHSSNEPKSQIEFEAVAKYIEQLHEQSINPDIVNLLSKAVNEIPAKMSKIRLLDPMDAESSTVLSASDKDAIKGLKTRIKKLENLLHQRSFQSNAMTGPPESKFSVMAKRSVLSNTIQGSENDVPGQTKSLSPTPANPGVDSTHFFKLQDENMHLTTDLKAERGKLETISDELRSLKQTLSTKEFENQALVKRLDNLQDEKTGDISKLQLELTMVQVDKENIESELQKKAEELESALKRHDEEMKTLDKGLRRELDNWKDKFKQQEDEFVKLREKEFQEHDVVETARKELQEVKEQLELIKEENDVVNERLRNSNSENKKLNDTLKNIKKENKTLKDESKTLTKDIDSMKIEKSKLVSDLTGSKNEIKKFQEQLESFKAQITNLKKDLKTKDNKISECKELLSEKDKIITQQSEQIDTELTKNKELSATISKHDSKLEEWEEDYDRLRDMKNDLLENMSNRESEFAKEKSSHHEEVDLLKGRIEELEQAQLLKEDLQEEDIGLIDKELERQSNIIFQLVIIINSLIIKSRDLSEILFQNYEIFCASLKSLGLLVVKNEKGTVNIIRFKGLKKVTDESTLKLEEGLSAGVVADVEKHLLWTELPDTTELISDLNQEGTTRNKSKLSNSDSLDSIVETLIENYNLTSFEEKYINFVSQITNLTPLYQVHISKRFIEVENLAKKELKENRKLKQDIQQKIAIRDFKKGDLVLFLPTSKDTEKQTPKDSDKHTKSWAAFNDMIDVKFFKKFDENWDNLESNKVRQWFIGKVLEIEVIDQQQNEFMISAEEVVF